VNIPFFDLKRIVSKYKQELICDFEESLERSDFIFGENVAKFEQNFLAKTGSKYCVSMSNGTDALLSIFMALNLKQGDEVIVPSFTFVASVSSIIRAGLKPIYVDLEKNSFLPSIQNIVDSWTPKTRAVLYVHLFGEYTDLSELKKICDEKDAFLIEDCAQSYGTPVGNFGIASAYSFFPAKNLGCLGDGGSVTTNDADIYNKIKKIRFHGSEKKYHYEIIGANFRLDSIQAGFLNIFIKYADEWIQKRRENARFYNACLAENNNIILPRFNPKNSYNQYSILVENRDKFKNYLDENNIENAIYYPIPIHKTLPFFSNINLLETENVCSKVISIPIYSELKDEELEKIKNIILEYK
jgi:dTDP-4-amino-4,6-dideoxygalactose transaminase